MKFKNRVSEMSQIAQGEFFDETLQALPVLF
jgi:hypothetical protein